MRFKLIYLLATLICFAACEKRDAIRNGTVEIEIVAPVQKSSITKTNEVEIEIQFSSKKDLVEATIVELSAFIEGEDSLENLEYLPSRVGEMLLDFEEKEINETEYTFKQSVDISKFEKGTCFIVYAGAQTSSPHTEGWEMNGSYFCID